MKRPDICHYIVITCYASYYSTYLNSQIGALGHKIYFDSTITDELTDDTISNGTDASMASSQATTTTEATTTTIIESTTPFSNTTGSKYIINTHYKHNEKFSKNL